MKTTLAILSLCACFVLGSLAHAQSNGQKSGQSSQVLTFDDLKSACENPARFHNQIAPSNIQISCQDLQYKWVPDNEGIVNMPTSRMVTSAVYSDKYSSTPISAPVMTEIQKTGCPQFVEVVESVETVRAVSCDEITAYKGTSIDFCADTVNSLRAANFNAVNSKQTGRVMSLCGSAIGDKRGQRGQN
ncbi:MAG: hypothetical protein COT73_09765 [Bdellovibrio sp. CG10_big_fil_rev_8_21_14_0_10_47_8]|nr:MAG: hypothetical protein COT73_09765 [Bdellovibrio sp. CG10_big_fil_rev_8_21_14_0_10_47_8]